MRSSGRGSGVCKIGFALASPCRWHEERWGTYAQTPISRDNFSLRDTQVIPRGSRNDHNSGSSYWIYWLGREDSNLRIAESKSAALPLGYAPIGANAKLIRTKLIAKAGAGKEAPGGTPPRGLGHGEPCARRIGRAAIVKQRKTGSATAAHARQPSAR